ncbi:uncharacterized protein LOC119726806 [Patiria miniata]|uniref:Uncharacterized protein n=1 Tax=Patiria miniata TaxID=46514 RepID=A0A913ZU43_PATMI|nr:uncharacterized protein LOC119726806 [Patiria miniata]
MLSNTGENDFHVGTTNEASVITSEDDIHTGTTNEEPLLRISSKDETHVETANEASLIQNFSAMKTLNEERSMVNISGKNNNVYVGCNIYNEEMKFKGHRDDAAGVDRLSTAYFDDAVDPHHPPQHRGPR